MLEVSTRHSELADRLRHHPMVAKVSESNFDLEFGGRTVSIGSGGEVTGVVELMDNNPLVCADHASTPNIEGTLATLALGPILLSGLVTEPPVVLFSFEADEASVNEALASVEYHQPVTFGCDPHDLGSVRGIYCIAKIKPLTDFDELDAIYSERYEKSFFMRLATAAEWDTQLVSGKSFAAYRLEITEGE
ncbi:MAG TPA: hypothetical protein VK171_16255, partial [Fimbriimonas sp.]|nr:hypothetical protein [Fimbriimonas sp.]